MSILGRIGNLVKAKANRVVEAAEKSDPVGIVKQQMMEAKTQLAEYEQAVRQMGSEKINVEKQVQEAKAEVADWGKKAELAMGEGNEELARKACERQTEAETKLNSLKTSLKTATANFEKMKQRLVEQKGLIDKKDGEMRTLESRQKAAQANLKMRETMTKYEGNGSALDQIDIFEQKVSEMESEAQAADDIEDALGGDDIEKEFAALSSDGATDDKMAALRAKSKK